MPHQIDAEVNVDDLTKTGDAMDPALLTRHRLQHSHQPASFSSVDLQGRLGGDLCAGANRVRMPA